MSLGARRAAPAAVIVACALAAPVAHADDRLVGTLAQVQDSGDLPPLTPDPPTPLRTASPTPTTTASETATPTPAGTPTATPGATAPPTSTRGPQGKELARTGSDAALAALAGLSLLGAGVSLRMLTGDGAPD